MAFVESASGEDSSEGSSPGKGIPYWRLSSFYFFYFALLGTMVPYLGLYLQSLHFSPIEIGQIFAVMMVTRVVAPNMWGWLADHTGRRLFIIRLGSLLACVCFSLLIWKKDFLWVAMIVAAYSFFWNAVLAQYEVITLGYLAKASHFYSRVRLWGSVGFIVAVVVLGYLFDHLSVGYLPAVGLAVLLLIWISSLTVREQKIKLAEHDHTAGFWQIVTSKPVACFLIASFFLQLSFGSYYTFYSVYLEGLSYSRGAIGMLWGLGVVAEVVVFWFMHRLLQAYSLRNIMLFTLAVTAVRWWLIGCYPTHVSVLFFAQLLHAFSFGTAHAAGIEIARRFFVGRHQGQGQALYSAVSFGAGGAAGALLSGLIWAESSVAAFALSAAASVLAFVVVWWGLRGAQLEVDRVNTVKIQ